MRTAGQEVRENEMVIPQVGLESVKAWAKATFTRERVDEAGLTTATMVLAGYLGSVLVKGIETYSMSGF